MSLRTLVSARLDRAVWVAGPLGPEQDGPSSWTPTRRRQRAAGRRWACEALALLAGVEAGRFSIQGAVGQRPCVHLDGRPAPGLHVSIAHTGETAIAAAARAPLGIDLEGPIAGDALDRLAFSAGAREAIDAAPPSLRPVRRAEQWCRLEAVGKLRGKGLSLPFSALEPSPDMSCQTGRLDSGEIWALVMNGPQGSHR